MGEEEEEREGGTEGGLLVVTEEENGACVDEEEAWWRDVVMPGPFIMQCLLGCAGVSPTQHNYSLFWCVVLGTTVF